jgi:hypothetical protein
MSREPYRQMVYGELQLRSPWFSNQWRLLQHGEELARVTRLGRIYTSVVTVADGTRWVQQPAGTGVVQAVDELTNEFARVTRRSWIGRRWDLTSPHFGYELVSDPRPRRWRIEVGGAAAATITGSLVSYNRVDVNAAIGVPLAAVLLGWHVIARPWEAVAEPRGLIPVSQPETGQFIDPRGAI